MATDGVFTTAFRHHEGGRLKEAERLYWQILASHPNHSDSLHLLGVIAQQMGRGNLAIKLITDAIAHNGSIGTYYSNLGVALSAKGRLDEAVACYRRALELTPDFPNVHYNLGNDLQKQGLLDEAAACYRRALDLQPHFSDAHNSLGVALQQQGLLDEAVTCYRRALDLTPNLADAHKNLAIALLAQGDMAKGWEEYEWRWKTSQMIDGQRGFSQPQWRGEPAQGRTLLIHAEQGFGDSLQFCRYASLAADLGFRVILEAPKLLIRLLRSLRGVDILLSSGEELPPFDLHCPMLSMPLALGTTITTIPRAAQYLYAAEPQVASWRTRLAAIATNGCRVGLAWAGSSILGADRNRRRSLAPDRMVSLFEVPGVQFFSLQKSGPTVPDCFPVRDFMTEMDDFADTAALIANLDLVISVDTAMAHLGAALGKPVWLLNRFDPCWRWLTVRRDSPWYPTLRLYRQPQPGDWDSVLAEVASDLRNLTRPDDKARGSGGHKSDFGR